MSCLGEERLDDGVAAEARWTTDAMAAALGVDLGAAGLSPAERQRLLARCVACPLPEVCTVWLSDMRGETRDTGRAPQFCPNKPALDALAEECR